MAKLQDASDVSVSAGFRASCFEKIHLIREKQICYGVQVEKNGNRIEMHIIYLLLKY